MKKNIILVSYQSVYSTNMGWKKNYTFNGFDLTYGYGFYFCKRNSLNSKVHNNYVVNQLRFLHHSSILVIHTMLSISKILFNVRIHVLYTFELISIAHIIFKEMSPTFMIHAYFIWYISYLNKYDWSSIFLLSVNIYYWKTLTF